MSIFKETFKDFVQKQIDVCISDIGVDAIKIGMVHKAEIFDAIYDSFVKFDIILSWCFVFSRVIHFFIRLKNQKDINIIPRTIAFISGLLFLSIGWLSFLLSFIKSKQYTI